MISIRSSRATAFVLVVVSSLAGSIAVAAEDTSVNKLVEEGVRLRIDGQYEAALTRFQRAHVLSPSPRTLAQIALAEADLKRWTDAERHLVEALGTMRNSWIEKNREVLSKGLEGIRTHIGVVRVTGPDATDVFVDDKFSGRLPLDEPLHLAEGKVMMEGRAVGRLSASTSIRIVGGQEVVLRLELPLTPPSAVPLPSTPSKLLPPKPVFGDKVSPQPVSQSSSWKTSVGIGLLVGAAGLVAWGVVWIAIDGSSPAMGDIRDTAGKGWLLAGSGALAATAGGLLLFSDHGPVKTLAVGANARGPVFSGRF